MIDGFSIDEGFASFGSTMVAAIGCSWAGGSRSLTFGLFESRFSSGIVGIVF